MGDMLSLEQIRELPKVALHDHLDGGLRPETVIEHCAENGHELPTTDPVALRTWFFEAADSGSLVKYLETFEHTVAAMQTAAQLSRVAREFVLDQAADGVIYAEARWAPEQHQQQGLSLAAAVEAVRDGLAEGMVEAEAAGRPIIVQQILTSLRHTEPATEVAELAVRYRDDSVCGFDIAGAEAGFPPTRFQAAFDLLRDACANVTVHAGEAAGVDSVFEALQLCGAHRLGHGVRIIEDIDFSQEQPRLGRVAHAVRDRRVALEVAPSSNLQTGIAETLREHPVDALHRLGFRVTVNCDNRLMSDTTMSREYAKLVDQLGWTIDDIEETTLNAMDVAFLHHDERVALSQGLIRPAFAAARREGQ